MGIDFLWGFLSCLALVLLVFFAAVFGYSIGKEGR